MYNLITCDIGIHPGNHHHNQNNENIHLFHEIPVPLDNPAPVYFLIFPETTDLLLVIID